MNREVWQPDNHSTEGPVLSGGEALTNIAPASHNVFMAQDQGQESSPVSGENPTSPNRVPNRLISPTVPQQIEVIWKEFAQKMGRDLTAEERERMEKGELPMGGGQEAVRTSWLSQEGDPEIEYQRLRDWMVHQERTLTNLRGREPAEFLEILFMDLHGLNAELETEQGSLAERRTRGELSEQQFNEESERLGRYRQEVERHLNRVAERIGRHLGGRETGHMSRQELKRIALDEAESERFLENILSIPEGRREEFYALDYISEVNIRNFLSEVRAIDRERHDRYMLIWGMRSRVHNMGVVVRAGDTNRFLEMAQLISEQHLQATTWLEGVEQVRQLYEKALASRLSEKPTIRPEDYMWVENWVRDVFGVYAQEKNWENWQIERALTVGSNVHAITLRIAEYITKGEIPERGQEQFASFNYETMTRLLAVYKWVAQRFLVGGSSRGQDYFKNLLQSLREGENISKLTHIGAVDRESFELPALHGASGFESGWRQVLAYLDILSLPEELRSIGQNVGDYLYRIGRDDFNGDRKEALKQLIENTHLSLGVLLAYDLRLGGKLSVEDAIEMKARIWGKVAKLMPSRTTYFLRDERINFLKQKINPQDPESVSDQQLDEYWQRFWPQLERKLAVLELKRVEQQGARLFGPEGRTDLVELDISDLSADEQEFIQMFQRFGRNFNQLSRQEKKLLEELAKVNFGGTTPFLDDVPFSKAAYWRLGTEAFKRRLGSDAPAFFNAGGEVTNLMANLNLPRDKVRETIKKMVDQLSTPHGDVGAQKIAVHVVKAYFDEAKEFWWATWIPGVGGIARLLRHPISNLQKALGPTAEALGPRERRDELFHYQSDRILAKEQVNDLQKKFGADVWKVLLHEGINLFILYLILAIEEFIKKVREER